MLQCGPVLMSMPNMKAPRSVSGSLTGGTGAGTYRRKHNTYYIENIHRRVDGC